MTLREVVQGISGFSAWNHAQKIKFFAWFLHSKKGLERVSSSDIKKCYDDLHLEKPSNVSPFLADMEKRKPKEAMKDSRGYYLAKSVRDTFEAKYGQRPADSTPKTEHVLPLAVVQGTRGYLERIILQANGCYEREWFDACAVMIRRFTETMIIEVYEAHGKAAEIKDSNGDFLMLRDIITKVLNDPAWTLQRETKKVLPEIKLLGDSSAHARRFIAKKPDVDKVLPGFRIAAEDLLQLANLK